MINRPKPPPHILKRLKEEEVKKKQKREKRNHNRTFYNQDQKNLTGNNFAQGINTDFDKESMTTEYPLKTPLKKIAEETEDEPYNNIKKFKALKEIKTSMKRGKSVNAAAMKSNGFAKSTMNNSTSYQSNFGDAAISTSTTKNFMQSPLTTIENKRNYQRSESLIARSACYSTIPCPH
jgi:hypothetical protein